MKARLLQLLDLEMITPSKFADLIGVQRSSVSHVLSGRNKPSFDFLEKTLKAFPGLKADWLILGEGTMYEQMGRSEQGGLFEAGQEKIETMGNELKVEHGTMQEDQDNRGATHGFELNESSEKMTRSGKDSEPQDIAADRAGRKIVQVMLFYDDDTFTSYKPNL
jgi:transcriptional regulator with XRE-family HTH domain